MAHRKVALAFPLRLGPWPDIVRGIYRYAGSTGPLLPWVVSLHTEEDVSVALAGSPDGVIAMVRNRDMAAQLKLWGGPVVDTAFDVEDAPFPQVGFDARGIGQLAADHLLNLKRHTFAFVGEQTPAGRGQWEGFVERLREKGQDAIMAPPGFDQPHHEGTESEKTAIAWLTRLPRPAAIFASHDAISHRLAGVCSIAGLRVPDEIALIGCLNDAFLCTTSHPPLSSISVPVPALGFEAARTLDTLMRGEPVLHRLELPPVGVAIRQSTDPLTATDPDLAHALRFIHQHAVRRISVSDIAAAAQLSRSTLERRFRAALGHGPLAELMRQRVERAKQLLAETDLAVMEVARAVGFHDTRHLTVTFRQKAGISPAQYRSRFRPDAIPQHFDAKPH